MSIGQLDEHRTMLGIADEFECPAPVLEIVADYLFSVEIGSQTEWENAMKVYFELTEDNMISRIDNATAGMLVQKPSPRQCKFLQKLRKIRANAQEAARAQARLKAAEETRKETRKRHAKRQKTCVCQSCV